MSETNPFAAPKAELSDPAAPPGRPVWVWVICIFSVIGFIGGVLSLFAVISGSLSFPREQQAYFASLNAFDHATSVAVLCANLFGAIQLFRLRRVSAYVYTASFVASLLLAAWHFAAKDYYAALGNGGMFNVLLGWVVGAAVCLYVWRLAGRGVLR